MTPAERQARRRKRVGPSINRTRRKNRRLAKEAPGREATRLRRDASRAALLIPDGMDLRIGDCRKVLADIPDNSVALILTDPPHGDEAASLYRWLAPFADRVLIPGGSLICYTSQSTLPRDMTILGEHLRWWWLCRMDHNQSQRKFFGKFVIPTFKPIPGM